MGSKVKIHAGDCGFINIIEVNSSDGETIEINIDSNCEKILSMQDDLKTIGWKQLFGRILDSPVYLSANEHLIHADCIVPSGILKVCKVELGFMLPVEAKIEFPFQSPEET